MDDTGDVVEEGGRQATPSLSTAKDKSGDEQRGHQRWEWLRLGRAKKMSPKTAVVMSIGGDGEEDDDLDQQRGGVGRWATDIVRRGRRTGSNDQMGSPM